MLWFLLLGYLVIFPSLAQGGEGLSCEVLVERALSENLPVFALTLKAGAKTSSSLEARVKFILASFLSFL